MHQARKRWNVGFVYTTCIKAKSWRWTLWLPDWLVGYGNSNGYDREQEIQESQRETTWLQDQLSLAEALKYARGLESANQHATKVENQAPTEVTIKQEVDKIEMEKKDRKLCFNCGKHWPQQGGARNCPAFGKHCTCCGKRNDFTKFFKSKQEISTQGWGNTDTLSKSSDESTCTLETVNLMGLSANKPLRTVIISGTSITVLQDSGATISVVDEATFQRYKLEKKVKIKTSRCHIKPYGVARQKKQTSSLL